MSNNQKGTLLTVLAGIAWGLSGASGQYLMVHGFTALVLTNVRLLVAGGVLVLILAVTARERLLSFFRDKKTLVSLACFALFGLLLNQYGYMAAIHETNAGTATVLQYICPVLILAYTCLRNRVAPSLLEICSIVLAISGTFLIATHGQLDQLSMTPLGLFWGIFSAFTYALYILLPIQLIKEWGSMMVIGVGMLLSGLVLTPFSGLLQFRLQLTGDIFLALIGIVVIGTIIAYTLFLKGTSLIGPVKSSLLASIEPIAAVFFAFLVMGEQFFAVDFIGMAMILLAVTLITLGDVIKSKKKVK